MIFQYFVIKVIIVLTFVHQTVIVYKSNVIAINNMLAKIVLLVVPNTNSRIIVFQVAKKIIIF